MREIKHKDQISKPINHFRGFPQYGQSVVQEVSLPSQKYSFLPAGRQVQTSSPSVQVIVSCSILISHLLPADTLKEKPEIRPNRNNGISFFMMGIFKKTVNNIGS